jgi:hypothetical protein
LASESAAGQALVGVPSLGAGGGGRPRRVQAHRPASERRAAAPARAAGRAPRRRGAPRAHNAGAGGARARAVRRCVPTLERVPRCAARAPDGGRLRMPPPPRRFHSPSRSAPVADRDAREAAAARAPVADRDVAPGGLGRDLGLGREIGTEGLPPRFDRRPLAPPARGACLRGGDVLDDHGPLLQRKLEDDEGTEGRAPWEHTSGRSERHDDVMELDEAKSTTAAWPLRWAMPTSGLVAHSSGSSPARPAAPVGPCHGTPP